MNSKKKNIISRNDIYEKMFDCSCKLFEQYKSHINECIKIAKEGIIYLEYIILDQKYLLTNENDL